MYAIPPKSTDKFEPQPPLIEPHQLVYLGSATVAQYRMTLAVGDNSFTKALDFIHEGSVWMISAATIYCQTNRLAGLGDISGFYGSITLLDPGETGVTVCQGPLWRTDIGIDEVNIQVPAFHGDYLVIQAWGVDDTEDVLTYIVKFLKVQ